MNCPELTRNIAARVPAELRDIRGRLMLQALCEQMGVQEVGCPACDGSGWLDRPALEHCPLCCGFQEVPERLAAWFRAQRLKALGGAETTLPDPAPAERLGRLAEVHYRAHVSGF
jgi:hypothetical protein